MNRIKKSKIMIISISCVLIALVGLTISNELRHHQKDKPILEVDNTNNIRRVQADYPSYKSIEEAYNTSDIVIKGKALESEVREITITKDGQLKYPYLVTKVKVSKALKGNIEEDSIVFVKQLVETENVKKSRNSNEELLGNSGQYYLFLESYEVDSSVMPCSIINPGQGNFKISEGRIIAIDKSMTVNNNDTNKKYLDGMDTIGFEAEINNIKLKKDK